MSDGTGVYIRMADGYGAPISVMARTEDVVKIGDEVLLRVQPTERNDRKWDALVAQLTRLIESLEGR